MRALLRALVIACVLLAAQVEPGSAYAEDRAPSPEAQAAAAQAGSDVSTDTYAAENLLYFLLYGGAHQPRADRVVQHQTGGTSVVDDGVAGPLNWVAGLGLALIPPHFDWFAFEGHIEVGTTLLDAKLREACVGCSASGEPEPSFFHMQAGFTVRATIPLRYLSLNLGAGPLVTSFVHDYTDRSPTPDNPATFTQWDGAFGLRLVAGIHFLLAPDIRLFVDYRHDWYMDTVGPPPASPTPGASPLRGTEVSGLRLQSVVAGLECNVPDFQQSPMRRKVPFVAVPIIAALVIGAFAIVPEMSED